MELLTKMNTMLTAKSRDGRMRLLLAILGALLVSGAVIAALDALWATDKAQVQGAVVGGLFTLIAAVGSLFVVFWQLRKQVENTARANRHLEALKLRKEIYEEFVAKCQKASEISTTFFTYVAKFEGDAKNARLTFDRGMEPEITTRRQVRAQELSAELQGAILEIILAINRWTIVDPRLEVFRFAFSRARYEIRTETFNYLKSVLQIMPIDDKFVERFGWSPPNNEDLATVNEATFELANAGMFLNAYIEDFQIEMQNTLLKEMFGDRALTKRRNPQNIQYRVVTLEDHEAVTKFLVGETEWGREYGERTTTS